MSVFRRLAFGAVAAAMAFVVAMTVVSAPASEATGPAPEKAGFFQDLFAAVGLSDRGGWGLDRFWDLVRGPERPDPVPTIVACPRERPTITGTPGNDELVGTPGRDVIAGLTGNDVIDGLGGDDVILAGTGRDTLLGGLGNDVLCGGTGNDVLIAGAGTDTIHGEEGNDLVSGSFGDDQADGGIGTDVLAGGPDADRMTGNIGNDALGGSGGDDGLTGDIGNDRLAGSDGTDTATGGLGRDQCDAETAETCEARLSTGTRTATLEEPAASEDASSYQVDWSVTASAGIRLVEVYANDVLIDYIVTGGREKSGSSTVSSENLPAPPVSVSVVVIDANGEQTVSETKLLVLPGQGGGPGDLDGDGLPDEVEGVAGTDPRKADTDGDGLSDAFEVAFGGEAHLGTNPDTDGDGTSDAQEDVDGDGLTALEEQTIGSIPVMLDTDSDGLDDGAEVRLGTSPANIDSDGDELGDNDEGPFGTDPKNPDTDGDGLTDGQEFLLGTNPTASDNDGSFDLNVAGPAGTSITVQGSAEAVLEVTATEPENPAVAQTAGIIGAPIDVTAPTPVTSGTIEIPFDPAQVPAGAELAILHFDEATGQYELAPNQEIANGVARTTTTSFSPFVLVDLNGFKAAFADALTQPREGTGGEVRSADSSLIIDSSGSMTSNDPNNDRLAASKAFIDALVAGDQVSVVDFDDSARLIQPLTADFAAAKAAVDMIDSSGGTNIGAGVQTALDHFDAVARPDTLKVAVLLTDGEGSYDPALTQRAVDSGVVIYTVALGSGADTGLLQDIATQTGGTFFQIENASDLPGLFDRIGNDPGGVDTDGDGLTDKTELEGIRDAFGSRVQTDPNVADTDGDGLSDGEEAGRYVAEFVLTGTPVGDYYFLDSDPTMRDTDRDGLDDREERDRGTKPRVADTDGDGFLDGQEVANGTDPLTASTIPDLVKGGNYDFHCGLFSCSLYLSNKLIDQLALTIGVVGASAAVVSLACFIGGAATAAPTGGLGALVGFVCSAGFGAASAVVGLIGFGIDLAARDGACLKITASINPLQPAVSPSKDSFCTALSRA